MNETVLMPKQRTGRPRKHPPKGDRLCELDFTKPTASKVVDAIGHGRAKEIQILGPRGEGKTIMVLGGMLYHAKIHELAGFSLPVKWIGFTDTFASHKAKTFGSLEKPFWKGCWRPSDGGHIWHAVVNGQPVVQLNLFGIEDQGAMDRVRTETHCVWCEEPAPTAVLVSSSGVTEEAWGMALTSQRLPTHAHVAVQTLNYPDEDHWTWQRFQPQHGVQGFHPSDPSRMWFRIPPGERADATERAAWAHALRERPDLLRRLVTGQPGSIALGPQVAEGFREDLHVAAERIFPYPNEPLGFGIDFGLTPVCIIGQPGRGLRRIYASLACGFSDKKADIDVRGGIKQLLENEVIPWLAQHAPWCLRNRGMVYGCYDVAGQTAEQSDIERDPVGVLEQLLPGLWFPGPVQWESRKHTIISAMNHTVRPGQQSLQIDPVDARGLIKALSSRWHYATDRQGQVRRDMPKKPNHPWEDYGDGAIYWLWTLTSDAQPPAPLKVETRFSLEQIPVPVEYAFTL